MITAKLCEFLVGADFYLWAAVQSNHLNILYRVTMMTLSRLTTYE